MIQARAVTPLDPSGTYTFMGFADVYTGQVYTLGVLFSIRPDKIVVDDLSVAYVYMIKALLTAGYECVTDMELRPHTFTVSDSSGKCSYLAFNAGRGMTQLYHFKSKYGIDFSDNPDENTEVMIYAEKAGRISRGIGADAYREFLHTVYKKKDRDDADYKLIREIMPELGASFSSSKRNVAGYQIAVAGRYSNVYSYDIRASYPASALNAVPYGMPKTYDHYVPIDGSHWAVYSFIYYGRRLRPGYVDFLASHPQRGIEHLPAYLYRLALDTYDFEGLHVGRSVVFKTRKSVFGRFIEKNVFRGRLAEISPRIAKYNKIFANSLIGYLGRNTTRKANIYTLNDGMIERKRVKVDQAEIYTPMYIEILDHAKTKFIRAINAADAPVIYANTDGFMTTAPINLKRVNACAHMSIGGLSLRRVYDDLAIQSINGYVGTYTDDSGQQHTDITVSGLRILSELDPERYGSHEFDYYVNLPQPDGTVCRTVLPAVCPGDHGGDHPAARNGAK